ncbi:transporter [Pendulispora albinea]|uniref:Transporter n=1 Tax=Pendulispora albinea TaxID=2741071 RepID=A0ABZ2LM62_9BACT
MVTGLFFPSLGRAETDPRDYALGLAPNHTNVFIMYARHQTSADSQNYVRNTAIFRYLHLLKFGNLAIVPLDVLVPVVDAQVYLPGQGGQGTTTLHGSGMGDLSYLPTIGYAIKWSEKDFTYFVFSSYLRAPTGNYDPRRPVNVGTNRWTFDEQAGIGHRFLGMFLVEAVGAAIFYTKNDDYILPGTSRRVSLQQRPTFNGTVHASMDISKEIWLGASYHYFRNGRVAASGPEGELTATDRQSIQSIRATVGLRPVEPLQVLLQYQTDIVATRGATISRFVGLRLSYRF